MSVASGWAMHVRAVLLRELRAVRREVEAYEDEALLWRCPPGVSNPTGTLALHVAGSLQHFVGARLGGSGWIRDRPREFSTRDVSRSQLVAEIDAAAAVVERVLPGLGEADLAQAFPEPILGQSLTTGDALLHMCAHLAYHLGQMDYHRRVVTGQSAGVGTLPPAELHTARAAAER